MRRFTLITSLCLILAACVNPPSENAALIEPDNSVQTEGEKFTLTTDGSIALNRNGLNIVFPRPAGWDSFSTADGIVVTEKFSSLADRGRLNGMMVYVFVTPLTDISPTAGTLVRYTAVDLLSDITGTPVSTQSPSSSPVRSLEWREHDAAYYTVTDRRARLQTLILGIVEPENGALVSISISAPLRMEQKIRALVPLLLAETTINGTLIGAAAAEALPDPLVFPE